MYHTLECHDSKCKLSQHDVKISSYQDTVANMSGDISLGCSALTKMLLHAARYPHSAVSGVVLAQGKGGETNNMVLVDAVPLFHLQLGLAPMLEVALTKVCLYERKRLQEKMEVIGTFQVRQDSSSRGKF